MPLSLELDYLPRLPKRRDFRIGCIGSGFIMADCHLVAYKSAGFHPVAIASRTPAHAASVGERHGLKVYDTYQDLLADKTIEVVDIAVPPDAQLAVIQEVVKHKKHIRGVLAQKPLGVDYAQAVEVVRLCKKAGIKLGGG